MIFSSVIDSVIPSPQGPPGCARLGTEQPGECSGLGCPIKLLTELVSWVGVFPVARTYLVLVAGTLCCSCYQRN